MTTQRIWTFRTRNFSIDCLITHDWNYRYDGDDENGETQAALDSGELVAFDTDVIVCLKGNPVGRASLGGSVYEAGKEHTFRDHVGSKGAWGSYFTDMVKEAIGEARATLCAVPKMRCAGRA